MSLGPCTAACVLEVLARRALQHVTFQTPVAGHSTFQRVWAGVRCMRQPSSRCEMGGAAHGRHRRAQPESLHHKHVQRGWLGACVSPSRSLPQSPAPGSGLSLGPAVLHAHGKCNALLSLKESGGTEHGLCALTGLQGNNLCDMGGQLRCLRAAELGLRQTHHICSQFGMV